jgi:hypothetical protein
MTDSPLREVYSAANTQEAHCVKGALESAGIEARVVGDHLQNAVGDLPAVSIAPQVWVRLSDWEQARQIVLARPAPANPWECPQCDEPNEGSFEICWNCQTARG